MMQESMSETRCYAKDALLTTPAACRSLYVHVPFCHTICGYCDFYSEVLDRGAAGPLVDALLRELDGHEARGRALRFETIFVGGGTPTTLPPDDLRRLLRRVGRDAAGGVEFTVEANPATVNAEVADALAESGVNRVSIGAQSFDEGELRVLERIHRPEQVAQTVEICRCAGIRSLNLDLIFAVPGQSLDRWMRNLERCLALAPDHMSCYGLTYERGTPLFDQLRAGRVRRVDEDIEAEMFEATAERLGRAGLRQYEISNYARPGAECRHNLCYWHNESYVGIGPSAAGYVDGVRYKNVPDTRAYVRGVQSGASTWIEQERLPPDATARETAMLELRLMDGIGRRRFAERFGVDPATLFADAIERHAREGRLVCDERGIRLTRAGLLLADTVIADFL